MSGSPVILKAQSDVASGAVSLPPPRRVLYGMCSPFSSTPIGCSLVVLLFTVINPTSFSPQKAIK